jgi:hypothetical protein
MEWVAALSWPAVYVDVVWACRTTSMTGCEVGE